MSPENARVFLVEDDIDMREDARYSIEDAGHKVISEVGTLQDALGAIDTLGSTGLDVAVLDGNLTRKDVSGNDGTQIAAALRSKIPNIKIVSFSAQTQTYGDVHVDKGNVDALMNLGETVRKL